MSHRATPIPGVKDAALRQAVVRIKSRQSLEKLTPSGEVVPGTGEVQDKVEYIVLQRNTWNKKPGPWLIWGTVGESDWKKIVFEK